MEFLYVNYRNPQMKYSRALQEMESYLSISSAEAQKDDFQNWLLVLKELEHVRKDKKGMEKTKQNLRGQIEKLRISLETVQKANKNLGDDVASLQEMVEKLRNLDCRVEEKRNLIK